MARDQSNITALMVPPRLEDGLVKEPRRSEALIVYALFEVATLVPTPTERRTLGRCYVAECASPQRLAVRELAAGRGPIAEMWAYGFFFARATSE